MLMPPNFNIFCGRIKYHNLLPLSLTDIRKKIEEKIYCLISDLIFLRRQFFTFKIKYFMFLEREYQNFISEFIPDKDTKFCFYNKNKDKRYPYKVLNSSSDQYYNFPNLIEFKECIL